MRITNTMMMNSTLRNVSRSKTNLNTAENQMSTEKKITRPSDDPIVAIRALSLRSSLSEINQYLKSNIPDAKAWLQVTEGALENMDSILSDIYKYCNQGASDQFTEDDRTAIIQVLKQYKDAVYYEANTDYADRYCFSGFKTDSSFTFLSSVEASKKYEITQELSGQDITKVSVMKDSVDISNISSISATDTPETQEVYRLRLAYNSCMSGDFSDINVDGTTYTPTAVTHEEFEQLLSDGTFDAATDTFYYVYDTGELIMSDDLYDKTKLAENISFTYQKDGFSKGEVRPEMYFNCTNLTDDIDYTQTEGGQAILYTINFNQTIQVNTLGNETLSYDIGRDIDDMCNALQQVDDIETKLAKLKEMQESAAYSDTEKEQIVTMITATEKELDYAKQNMENIFSIEMTNIKAYQQVVDLQLADLGARSTRLTLAENRLTEQSTTFNDLKSKNEDVELEDTVIQYSSASTLYEAALTAASQCVKKSLLDYI